MTTHFVSDRLLPQSQSSSQHFPPKMSRSTEQSPWDCSRQYERYSFVERRRIISLHEQGQSTASIAQQLKRGEWAITVVIARHFNQWKSRTANNRRQIPHTKLSQKTQSKSRARFPEYNKFRANAQQSNSKDHSHSINSIKRIAQRNRKFKGKNEIVSASAKEITSHLKALLRGSH